MKLYPSYLNLGTKELEKRIEKTKKLEDPCVICPRRCKAHRLKTNLKKLGFCLAKDKAKIYSYHPHFGEESCLVGESGSGTIFFSSCNLACVYCQNWEISQQRLGKEVTKEELAQMMIDLQELGCHNINFVSPTPYVPQILEALPLAIKKGLKIPLVYNTGGYDLVETLKLLEGIIDIYMPDIKYSDNKAGLKYSKVPNYWTQAKKALKEMHRQVGDLIIEKGIAKKGLLIRHLILPNNIAGSKEILKFIASEISIHSFLNIMDQYYPANQAYKFPELSRKISIKEFQEIINYAKKLGFYRFDQEIPLKIISF